MEFRPGLEEIIAAETKISFLDVENEEIVIRGYDLIKLAETKTYTEAAHLLIEGKLPSPPEKERFEMQLHTQRTLPQELVKILKQLPQTTHPMDALRTGISVLASFDPHLDERTEAANKEKAIKLLAQIPAIRFFVKWCW